LSFFEHQFILNKESKNGYFAQQLFQGALFDETENIQLASKKITGFMHSGRLDYREP
jgi:hypothetical protein